MQAEPEIRPAASGDLAAVRDIVERSYAKWVPRIGRRPMPMEDDYAARLAAQELWVLAPPAGAVLGLLVLVPDGDALMLENVAVDPSTQHRGFGRRLLSFTEAEARRRGFPAIRLYTNAKMTENIALYEQLGFHQTRRVREQEFERVYMEKPLP